MTHDRHITHRTIKIQVGTGFVSPKALRVLLVLSNCNLDAGADKLLDNAPLEVTKDERDIALALITVAELGHDDGATFAELCDTAQKVWHFGLLNNEVGPQLCYQGRLKDEEILIAMKPFINSEGVQVIYKVCFEGLTRWLRTTSVHPDNILPPDTLLAFALST